MSEENIVGIGGKLAGCPCRLDETVEAIGSGTLVKAKQNPDRELEELGVLVNPHILQPAPVVSNFSFSSFL